MGCLGYQCHHRRLLGALTQESRGSTTGGSVREWKLLLIDGRGFAASDGIEQSVNGTSDACFLSRRNARTWNSLTGRGKWENSRRQWKARLTEARTEARTFKARQAVHLALCTCHSRLRFTVHLWLQLAPATIAADLNFLSLDEAF